MNTLSLDSELRYGAFTLRTHCPRCGTHLPVNKPGDAVICQGCDASIPVPREVFEAILKSFECGWPNPPEAGVKEPGASAWRWTAAPLDQVRCPACDVVLPEAETVRGEHGIRCSCGAALSTKPATLAMQHATTPKMVFYQESTPNPTPEPRVMTCPQCGGSLTITQDHARLHTCGYCGSQVRLPDAIWACLHPVMVHPWVVRFEGRSRAYLDHLRREKRALKEAQQAEKRRLAEERERRGRQAARAQAKEAARAQREDNILSTPKPPPRPSLLARGMLFLAYSGAGLALLMMVTSIVASTLGIPGVKNGIVATWGVIGVAGLFAALAVAGWQPLDALLWIVFAVIGFIPLIGPFAMTMFVAERMLKAVDESKPVPRHVLAPLLFIGASAGWFAHFSAAVALDVPFLELMWVLLKSMPDA